jgi:hypothetical protein
MLPAIKHHSSSLRRNPVNRIINSIIKGPLLIGICLFNSVILFKVAAQQTVPIFKDAIATQRTKTYNNITKNIILKNLSLPLTDSTEQQWAAAFYAAEVLQYKQLWVVEKVKNAFANAHKQSDYFKQALVELAFANYKSEYVPEVAALIKTTTNAKLVSMCAEYIIANKKIDVYNKLLQIKITEIKKSAIGNEHESYCTILLSKLTKKKILMPAVKELFYNNFLPGQTIILSLQRKNRNYPGLVLVRKPNGNFVTDSTGNIFNVPQLARSINNMPGYITNGNTPQGIFMFTGFDVSKSNFIGPTTNLQLVLPFEKSSTVPENIATDFGNNYTNLLPKSWLQYFPIYEAYYAGLAGRTEIIAHGTTVDPNYYKNQPYYPHTPTQGCLCTKEIWSASNGQRLESNQQKLVDAVEKTETTNGYLFVIEIDDKSLPVTMADVLPLLNARLN